MQMPTGQATAGTRRSFQSTSARMAACVTKRLWVIGDVVDVFEAKRTRIKGHDLNKEWPFDPS
jgi:hypothetical protein